MRKTGNAFDAQNPNNPEEPSCNTGKLMACLFDRAHINISLRNFGKHLRRCAGTRRRRICERSERDYQGKREKLLARATYAERSRRRLNAFRAQAQ
jgi:hypothetical protein